MTNYTQHAKPSLKGKALPRFFWDNIDMGKTLFKRLSFLSIKFDQIIKDLSANAAIANGAGAKVNRINWILQNNANGYPGIETQRDVLSARKYIATFSSLNFEASKQNRFVSTNELETHGFTDASFITALRQVSTFIAWAYNLEIPDRIKQIIESIHDDPKEIPADERIVTEDDLANNRSYRFPFIIIIDNSLSMGEGNTLERLQQGLTNLFHEISKSAELSRKMELFVATCGGEAKEIVGFAMIDRQEQQLDSLLLRPFGACKMADTIQMALDKLKERLDTLRKPSYDISFYEPWMLILSDGKFKGDMPAAIQRIKTDFPMLQVYARGISPAARMEALKTLDSKATTLGNMEGFFKDVFNSLEKLRYSDPGGERVHLVQEQSFTDNK